MTHPILFERNPIDGLGRVMKMVVDPGRLGSPQDFVSAIDQALTSPDDLAKTFSEDHTDKVIREFLIEVRKTLLARPPATP